jgi:acetyl-CoA C-acetyltransferase
MSKTTKQPALYVIGTAITKFGELWNRSLTDLAGEVVAAATADMQLQTSLPSTAIDAVFVANKAAANYQRQHHLGALISDMLPNHPPGMKIEGACASGGLALMAAEMALRSGQYQTVMVVGIEKMTDVSSAETTAILSGAADTVAEYGSTFPGLYALLAQAHMEHFGTTRQHLSAVAVKNHANAQSNSKAQFRNALTIEAVSNSQIIAEPLRLLDCSPISDGAAAVILTTNTQMLNKNTDQVRVVGYGHGQDSVTLANRSSLTELAATSKAAQQAFLMAGLTPKHINAAEVHDCFTIAEILAIEDLGFVTKGQGGFATLHKTVPTIINPSGGLKACGHPVGATGVKQLAFMAQYLRSTNQQYGLTHNVGGSGATAVVHIVEHVS